MVAPFFVVVVLPVAPPTAVVLEPSTANDESVDDVVVERLLAVVVLLSLPPPHAPAISARDNASAANRIQRADAISDSLPAPLRPHDARFGTVIGVVAVTDVAPYLPPPGSIVRRRATDVRLFGAAGYALILQVGHPTIAAGVRDHSNYAVDPWGRFFGTADFVNLLVYGKPEQVTTAATRLREMHRSIRGTDPDGAKYSALEPSAYAWVHATLAEAIVRGHRVFGTEFTASEKETFWAEWLRLGALLGIRDGDLPDTWTAFQLYLDEMIETTLVNNDVVEAVQGKAARATGGSPFPWLPARAWSVAGRPLGVYGAFLARGTMGAALRAKFEIPWSARQQRRFARVAAVHRAARPIMVPPLRRAGPLALKVRRRAIAAGPFS